MLDELSIWQHRWGRLAARAAPSMAGARGYVHHVNELPPGIQKEYLISR